MLWVGKPKNSARDGQAIIGKYGVGGGIRVEEIVSFSYCRHAAGQTADLLPVGEWGRTGHCRGQFFTQSW